MPPPLSNPLTKFNRTGVRGLPSHGNSGHLIGQAMFSSQASAVTSLVKKGCIRDVTWTATGTYKVWLWPYQTYYIPHFMSCDDNINAINFYLSGASTNITPQSFICISASYNPIAAAHRTWLGVNMFAM